MVLIPFVPLGFCEGVVPDIHRVDLADTSTQWLKETRASKTHLQLKCTMNRRISTRHVLRLDIIFCPLKFQMCPYHHPRLIT